MIYPAENLPKLCSGCSACVQICPAEAVRLEPDEDGFLRVITDLSRCCHCNLCEQVCPFSNPLDSGDGFDVSIVYAAKHNSAEVKRQSSSGGVFSALSDAILSENGVVFGAVYDSQWNVHHQAAFNSQQRDKQRGSKYVQSNMGNSYSQIESLLTEGKKVLFSGTPCQNAGLKLYLKAKKIDTSNLFLCDLVCHGVESPRILKDHIVFLEEKYKSPIARYEFRASGQLYSRITFQNGVVIENTEESGFALELFFQDKVLNSTCLQCPFAAQKRCSDITIGDYWGIEKSLPDFADYGNVSLVLINSPQGEELLERSRAALILRESNWTDCKQRSLEAPMPTPEDYLQFKKTYREKGFLYILHYHFHYGFYYRMRFRVIRRFYKLFGKQIKQIKSLFTRNNQTRES